VTQLRCVAVAAIIVTAGCSSQPGGDGQSAAELTVLQDVDGLLRAAAGAAGRAPGKLGDLDRFQGTFPRGHAAVKSGDVVVLWGATLQGEGQVGKNESVVAYEKATPASGGFVLLSAGTVRKMTSAEFAAAPKANTSR